MDAELNFEHLSSVLSSSANKDVMVDNTSLPTINQHERNASENDREQKQGPDLYNRGKITEEFGRNYNYIRERSMQHVGIMKSFKGFTLQQKNFMNDYFDTKSEVCYRFYKSLLLSSKRNILQMRNGIIPIGTSSTKVFLIAKNYLTKPKQNLRNGQQTRVVQHHEKTKPKASVKQNALDLPNIKSDDGTVTPGTLNALTSTPSLNSKPTVRKIQTPKRYMDGELGRTSAKSRRRTMALDLKKNKEHFQIGLLPPKYPKEFENGSWDSNRYDSQAVRLDRRKSNKKQTFKEHVKDDSGLFAISNLLRSGELLDIMAQHERKCRKLTGSEVSGVFQLMRENQNGHNPEAETTVPSQVTIDGQIPIPTVFAANTSLYYSTRPRVPPKSFKKPAYTSQKSRNTPINLILRLIQPKLRLNGPSTININGSSIPMPYLTGRTFKKRTSLPSRAPPLSRDLVQKPQQNTYRQSRISATKYIGIPVSDFKDPKNLYLPVVDARLMPPPPPPPLKSRLVYGMERIRFKLN